MELSCLKEEMMKPGELKLPYLFPAGATGPLQDQEPHQVRRLLRLQLQHRDGFITEREFARMRIIARTGCGMITNQGAYPDPLGEGKAYFRQVAIFDDKFSAPVRAHRRRH